MGPPEEQAREQALALDGEGASDVLAPIAGDGIPRNAAAEGDPTVVFLWYATGGPAPPVSPTCRWYWTTSDPTSDPTSPSDPTYPAYQCQFGSDVDDCKRQVQTYLDRWYADFNVIFTFTQPTNGPFYTSIQTSGNDWCGVDPKIKGLGLKACALRPGLTSYALQCGGSAQGCAFLIAQEHAHGIGLEHTTSTADVMHPLYDVQKATGFEDRDVPVSTGWCGHSTQNSYRLMKERLGAWPGGSKPDPFAPTGPDGGMGAADGAPADDGGAGGSGGTGGDAGPFGKRPGGDVEGGCAYGGPRPTTDDPDPFIGFVISAGLGMLVVRRRGSSPWRCHAALDALSARKARPRER